MNQIDMKDNRRSSVETNILYFVSSGRRINLNQNEDVAPRP